MNFKRVLVATDFSTASDAAIEYAATLAQSSGGTLYIVHVEEPPPSYGVGELYYGVPLPRTDDLMRMLHAVRPADDALPCEHRLLLGDPAQSLCEFAAREQINLMVLATHGRTGLARMLLGSVAEAVVREAPCPVLALKHPAAPARPAVQPASPS